MVEYWAPCETSRGWRNIRNGILSQRGKVPNESIGPNKEYTVSLNLNDDDQLLIQNMSEDDDAEETSELLKDLFPDFSYVKRKRKPKRD